jgi:hypothetical protein
VGCSRLGIPVPLPHFSLRPLGVPTWGAHSFPGCLLLVYRCTPVPLYPCTPAALLPEATRDNTAAARTKYRVVNPVIFKYSMILPDLPRDATCGPSRWVRILAVRATVEGLQVDEESLVHLVGRCRLTVSKPELKARLVSALETKM